MVIQYSFNAISTAPFDLEVVIVKVMNLEIHVVIKGEFRRAVLSWTDLVEATANFQFKAEQTVLTLN